MDFLPHMRQILNADGRFLLGCVAFCVAWTNWKNLIDGAKGLTGIIKDFRDIRGKRTRRGAEINSAILKPSKLEIKRFGNSNIQITKDKLKNDLTKWHWVFIIAIAISFTCAIALAYGHARPATVAQFARAAAGVLLDIGSNWLAGLSLSALLLLCAAVFRGRKQQRRLQFS
jgi:hypothetical protein